MNKVAILGTITRDIELRYAPSGTAIASFSIAHNEKRKGADGQYVDKAHFFEVVAFGKQGEAINQYFRKGSRILIDGSLDFQQWQDQNGNKRSKVSIKLNGFDFIDKKTDNTQPNQQSYSQPQQRPAPKVEVMPPQSNPLPPDIDIDEDEIPF